MLSFEGISQNFRLLIVQVIKQLENTGRLLKQEDARLIRAITSAENYIDTQKSMIEDWCFEYMGQHRIVEAGRIDVIRALNVITSNLERVSDFSQNIARQTEHLRHRDALGRFDTDAYLRALINGVGLIERALFDRDSSRALRICQVEEDVDGRYRTDLAEVLAALRDTRDVDDLVTVLFILHYLERMGDALLNVGEALIIAATGERLKLHQYRSLENALAAMSGKENPSVDDADVASIWGTRSGVRIGTLDRNGGGGSGSEQRVLFKQGEARKLAAERASLERWHELAPGLVPEVIEYQEREQGAALLLQYLEGATLREIVLNAERDRVFAALHEITNRLELLWQQTRRDEPTAAGFLRQLADRMEDVHRLHPDIGWAPVHIGTQEVLALPQLVEQARAVDAATPAPFSVFIHGDFNLDNIIYNARTNALHFIDVYRSREMDYVQDVTVFLVSGFRLPVFVSATRRVLEEMSLAFLEFARDFARAHDDETFETRLALGLARSFATSARFELSPSFARSLYERAELLLRLLLREPADGPDGFRVPDDVLLL